MRGMTPVEFFHLVIERIEAHPRYGALMRNAVAAQEELVLNYHTHGAGQPYCVAVGVYDGAIAQLGILGEFREVAHIRGVGRDESECEPLMGLFAALLQQRYELAKTPRIYLAGAPFEPGSK
jgi:hypothetical protein